MQQGGRRSSVHAEGFMARKRASVEGVDFSDIAHGPVDLSQPGAEALAGKIIQSLCESKSKKGESFLIMMNKISNHL